MGKRDPERPKRPLTGFLRFVAEKRKSEPDVKATALLKKASEQWKAMSEVECKPYNQSYELEKARYAEELKAYKASGKEEAWKSRVGIKTDAEKAAEKAAAKEKEKAAAAKKKAAKQKKKEAEATKKKAAAEKKKALADKKKAK